MYIRYYDAKGITIGGIELEKISLLVSTGNLGDNIIEEGSFYEGVKRQIDCFAADAGTADAGPTFLGADMPTTQSNGRNTTWNFSW